MEALAIVFVAAVAAIIFVVTWFGAANDPNRGSLAERDQLEAYRDVLQKRALRAQLERWDESMMEQIADQLTDVEKRLAKLPDRA